MLQRLQGPDQLSLNKAPACSAHCWQSASSVYTGSSIFCLGKKSKEERSKQEAAVGFAVLLILILAACCLIPLLPPLQGLSFPKFSYTGY